MAIDIDGSVEEYRVPRQKRSGNCSVSSQIESIGLHLEPTAYFGDNNACVSESLSHKEFKIARNLARCALISLYVKRIASSGEYNWIRLH